MTKRQIPVLKQILLLLFAAFLLLAITRTVYNLSKLVTEEGEWIGLSDHDKRYKLFGNLYLLLSEAEEKTGKDTIILFVSDDIRTHHLSRYYLYPRHIKDISVSELAKAKTSSYPYIALYFNNTSLLKRDEISKLIKRSKQLYKNEHGVLIQQ